MISHLFLHQGRESFFILALTSSTGKCDAARVILATFLFSSSAHNSCENSTTASNLVLEHVSRTFSEYFLVIQVDQAGWHRAKDLVVPENIRLIPQPAYSPELNPVEHIWEEIREKAFYNRAFP